MSPWHALILSTCTLGNIWIDDNWANIFTDAEAHTAEYLDMDSNDSDYIPRTGYGLDGVHSEEDKVGPAIQYECTKILCITR